MTNEHIGSNNLTCVIFTLWLGYNFSDNMCNVLYWWEQFYASNVQRSGSRSASPRGPRTADGGLRDSRSHSRSRKSRDRKETHREVKYSRSRSRSVSRGRKAYHSSKYTSVAHRGSSRSRSRSPYRGGRYSRSRSRSYSRSRYSRDRHVYRSHSRSPMSSRRRHIGNRDNPGPSRCLGVFGLSIFTTEQQIHQIFSKYGPVERIVVVIDAKVFIQAMFKY